MLAERSQSNEISYRASRTATDSQFVGRALRDMGKLDLRRAKL